MLLKFQRIEKYLREGVEMKKVCIIGHFGFDKTLLNGQTIKTKVISEVLKKQIGSENVTEIDTHGGVISCLKLPIRLFSALRNHMNIVILPAQNGLRIIAPILNIENHLFNRKLHYVVIGGWLPEFIRVRNSLKKALQKFNSILVEVEGMKRALTQQGFKNIDVMPNFKDIEFLEIDELVYKNDFPIRVCTFSRVMKEKGIEEAIDAVVRCNNSVKDRIIYLDIYGQVDQDYVDRFKDIIERAPEYIGYKGMIPSNDSINIIKNYQALLFPTYYEGEGFAGTLIDALAAGVPVIASDWRYNAEIIRQNVTGVIYKTTLYEALYKMIDDINAWNTMKTACIEEAKKYKPENAIQILLKRLD